MAAIKQSGYNENPVDSLASDFFQILISGGFGRILHPQHSHPWSWYWEPRGVHGALHAVVLPVAVECLWRVTWWRDFRMDVFSAKVFLGWKHEYYQYKIFLEWGMSCLCPLTAESSIVMFDAWFTPRTECCCSVYVHNELQSQAVISARRASWGATTPRRLRRL